MKKIWIEWLDDIRSAWFAPRCPLCEVTIDIHAGLCAGCARELPVLAAQCRHCALPLPGHAKDPVCPQCARRPRFDQALAAFAYHEPIAWLICGLKYRAHQPYGRVLGDLLAERVRQADCRAPDLMAPVPLHLSAYRRRGFNQAERIAARLERRLGWPLVPELFRRVRDTPRQSTLSARARAGNVRGAFEATRRLDGCHVALIDDVMTTTRTAAALAQCARRAGAARVDVYCVARA